MYRYGGFEGEVAVVVEKIDKAIGAAHEAYKVAPFTLETVNNLVVAASNNLDYAELLVDNIQLEYGSDHHDNIIVNNSENQFLMEVSRGRGGAIGSLMYDLNNFHKLYVDYQ